MGSHDLFEYASSLYRLISRCACLLCAPFASRLRKGCRRNAKQRTNANQYEREPGECSSLRASWRVDRTRASPFLKLVLKNTAERVVFHEKQNEFCFVPADLKSDPAAAEIESRWRPPAPLYSTTNHSMSTATADNE